MGAEEGGPCAPGEAPVPPHPGRTLPAFLRTPGRGARGAGSQPALACVLPLQLFLPYMRKKPALASGGGPEGDLLQEHWLVEDMFTFENVGFTKDVGNIKFLVCADCEVGPIGWHCLDDKDSFYVALDRVSHE